MDKVFPQLLAALGPAWTPDQNVLVRGDGVAVQVNLAVNDRLIFRAVLVGADQGLSRFQSAVERLRVTSGVDRGPQAWVQLINQRLIPTWVPILAELRKRAHAHDPQ